MSDMMEIDFKESQNFLYYDKFDTILIINNVAEKDEDRYIDSRLKQLMIDCFHLEEYFQEVNSMNVYAVNPEELSGSKPRSISELNEIVKVSPSYIVSFMTIAFKDEFAEIWNVCTEKKFRSKGYSSKILTTIMDLEADLQTKPYLGNFSKYWLCVEYDQPQFPQLMRFYNKNGFDDPCITQYMSDGATLINPESTNKRFVAMTRYTAMSEVGINRI